MKVDAINTPIVNNENPYGQQPTQKKPNDEQFSLEQTIEQSAVSVELSMNAQVILFEMNTKDLNQNNLLAQTSDNAQENDILSFLAGTGSLDGLSLKDIGYEGKPILELSSQEASELVSEDGFFGITQTSDRVSNFVFSFANDDLELLQKGREGIVQGFEEAERLFGGELPEISYKTQERTLQLIDEKIASVKGE